MFSHRPDMIVGSQRAFTIGRTLLLCIATCALLRCHGAKRPLIVALHLSFFDCC